MSNNPDLTIEEIVTDDPAFWAIIDMQVNAILADNPKISRESAQETVFGHIMDGYSLNHSGLYAVRDKSGKVIASALGGVHPGISSPSGQPAFEIFNVFVDPSRRNHRISYHVTAYMLNAAKNAGFREVFAKVPFKDNAPQRLFQRLGFQLLYTELMPNLKPLCNVYSKTLH